jgi:RHS repeat-associated protein
VGLGDLVSGIVDDVASAGEHLVEGTEHVVGKIAEDGAQVAGDGLDTVGLHGAAQAVEKWGERAADYLGDTVAEKQLGGTTDPTELVHGDVGALDATVEHLKKLASAFGETARGLGSVDTAHWVGPAAEAFRAKYAPYPTQWSDAEEACANAAGALGSYASTARWAQGQAQQAIDLYATGQRATQQAEARYQQAVEGYHRAADAYNAAVSAGRNPGVRPTQPGAFADPGQPDRQRAEELLSQARRRRDSAGSAAQAAISAATGLAPAEPSFGRRLLDDVGDTLEGVGIAEEHLLGGVAKGVFGIVSFVRSLNPLDPYNLTHPAEYVDGLSATAAGLVHAALHPTALVHALVGTGWGSDPAEALGKLVPNLALVALTDGAGTAADVGAGAAERVGLDAAEASGARAVREAAGDPVDNARSPAQMTCRDDPVDVASGHMVLPQTDVELPGVLPLVVERTHVSSYRVGRWFGPSWASTLDQRLEADAQGVLYTAPDGVVLCYPPPGVGAPVLPVEGARWPLTRTEDGGYTITDPRAGRTLHFASLLGGCWPITAVTDRTAGRISVGYDEAGTPLEIAHDGGYRIRVDTGIGRVTGLWLVGAGADGADVELVRYGYSGGRLSEVTNSSGQALRFGYDQVGRIVEWVDRNDTWYRYSYDAEGRCVRVAGADGFLTGSFDYDREHRVTTHTDAFGAVSRFEFDERLRVVAETDPLWNTTRSEWDRYGRLTRRTDPLGRVSRYGYDEVSNLLRAIRPDGSQVVAEYNGLSLPTVLVDADGAVWRHEYDEVGNRVASTDPAGFTTRYRYDQRGHLTAVTDALGHTSEVQTNAAGLPVAVTDPTGATTRYVRNAFGRATEVTDPVGGVTRMGWTVEGRPAWRTWPDGSTEHWSYDGEGNLTEYTDPLGQVTRTEYTHFDLPAARTTPDGARLEYHYDPELRLVSVTNPQGLVWRYDYDAAGRLVRESDFNHRMLRYSLDAAGQLLERVNGAGQAVRYVRDLLGNVTEQHSGGDVTYFDHDPAGRLVHATNSDCELTLHRDPLGRITAETLNGRTLTTGYDPLGRKTHRRTPSGVTSRWEHDAAGNPTTLHTAGRTLSFTHDPAGREVERRLAGTAAGTRFLLTQTWDPGHRLTSQTLLGGEIGSRHRQPAPAAGDATRLLQRRAYAYRPDGHLVGIDDHLSGPRRFELDIAGRVTTVHGAYGTEHYSYDRSGNITSAAWPTPAQEPTTDTRGHRSYTGTLITGAGNIRYQHDPQGRVVVRHRKRRSAKNRIWRYTWDADDRLTDVTTPDGARWHYRYDPLGRRVAKQRLAPGTGPSTSTVVEQVDLTWDGNTLAEQTLNRTHTTTWDYEPGSHRPLTQTEHRHSQASQQWVDQQFYAIVTDLIGTPTDLIDTNGAIAWHGHTALWGAALTGLANHADVPLRFPGQYHDPETGLHYNHHRYYDPETGRYATTDPLGLAAAPNPHTYVPNPHHEIDPLGLAPCTPGSAREVPSFFRGARPSEAPSFVPRPNEFKIDPATGTVRPTHGVSVFDNPQSVSSKGFVPHEVDQSTISGELRVIQRGSDPRHYEIVPQAATSLTPEQFTELLCRILCKAGG